ncbi:MAG: hypothetical protein L3K02_02765 [Thermoplasmata archaeon]|nr:hypothetical protein [Thermoplasmata archaeon]
MPLTALAYYLPTRGTPTTWDPGLVERLIVASILIWGAGVSVHLGRLTIRRRFSPGAPAKPGSKGKIDPGVSGHRWNGGRG